MALVSRSLKALFLAAAILISHAPFFGLAQKMSSSNSSGFSYIKYGVCFVDQVQVLYDGLDLNKITHTIPAAGDMMYYKGKYFNAIGQYFNCTNGFPYLGETVDSDQKVKLANGETIVLNGARKGQLNYLFSGLTLYSRMTTVDEKRLENGGFYSALSNSVGLLYLTRGSYVKAETLLTNAIEYRAKKYGRTSPEFINSLHNMAVLKKSLGEYQEAEAIFNYMVPTARKLYQYSAPEKYAVVLNNHAMLLAELGRSKEAIEELEEALSIGKDYFKPNYIDYERLLTNRAFLAQEANDYEKARELYKQVLQSMEYKGFEEHPDYNNVLIYYGSLRVARNEANILPFLENVIEKIEKRYGDDHPLYAKAKTNVGDYYLQQNRFDLAQPVFQKTLEVQLNSLGEKHGDYLQTLVKLGICNWYLRDVNAAKTNFNQSLDGYMDLVATLFDTFSESEKSDFWRRLKPSVDVYMSFAVSNWELDPDLLTSAYELHIKTKGLLINSSSKVRKTIMASGDSTLTAIYRQYYQAKKLLANYYSMSVEDLKEDKISLAELESHANLLEKELVTRSAAFSNQQSSEVSMAQIKQALPPNSAAIEVVRVPHTFGERKGEVDYAMLVVKKASQHPEIAMLNNGSELESKWLKLYKNSIRLKLDDGQSYQNYWEPVDDLLAGIERIYVSVDGVYNSININTLKQGDQFLLEKYELVLLPNTKFIGDQKKSLTLDASKEAVLFGAPDYGESDEIDYLPGTKVEVMTIDELLEGSQIDSDVFLALNASEANINKLQSPAILHVATHGFFLPDVNLQESMIMGVQVSKAKDNPLLRSGLLLAGAARAYGNEPVLNSSDNGILNAFEAMSLDLSNTDIVIMSACETGTGEIVNGEGVYGLSRSFQIAGAQKILMSLWKVDDEATKGLMTAFYKHWIDMGDPQKAFTAAQQEVKAQYKDPYYWGSFVLLN